MKENTPKIKEDNKKKQGYLQLLITKRKKKYIKTK